MMEMFAASRLRQHTWLVCLALCVGAAIPASAQLSSGLISQERAASVGLKRAWFARAAVNPSRSKVTDWILSQDQLLIVTDAGVLQAVDANTGKTMWTTQFGHPEYPNLGPAANDELVAVINGSTLYLLDRKGGRIQSQRQLTAAPGASPALGKDFAFVPTINGVIEGYPVDPKVPDYKRWFYQSYGRILAPPLVTPESLAWTTAAGYLYVGGSVTPGVHFRLETLGQFDARPAYRAPLIYAVSLAGEVFAIHEQKGSLQWRYLTGFPTSRAPAAVGERLFVTSEEPKLHCVDATTGLPQWETLGISQFAAVTKLHVYGVDRYGTIHILNIADGAPVGRIATGGTLMALVNDQTDRLYLISDSGLVQCLYEIGADAPTHYAEPSAEKKEEGAEKATETKPTGEGYRGDGQPTDAPAAAPAPTPTAAAPGAGPAAPPAAETDNSNPFGAKAEEAAPPAEKPSTGADDANPFE